jgi:hypothetical protein
VQFNKPNHCAELSWLASWIDQDIVTDSVMKTFGILEMQVKQELLKVRRIDMLPSGLEQWGPG